MNIISKQLIIAVLAICVGLASTTYAETPEEKGWKIMKAVDNLPTFEKSQSETIFKIYDAQGSLLFTKKARSASLATNYQDPDKRLSNAIMYFYAPADDKGNGALMIEKPGDEEDDQWMYLKGLRKPKRVIGSDKSSSYMGSDFTNGDLARGDFDEYNYKWLASEKIKFKKKTLKVEKIEIAFKDKKQREDYGYSKMVSWVHPQSGLIIKGEKYNLDGQLNHRMNLLSFTIKKNKVGKKVFMITGMQMSNLLKGTKTIMEMKKLKVEKQVKKIKPSIFALEYLTRRWW